MVVTMGGGAGGSAGRGLTGLAALGFFTVTFSFLVASTGGMGSAVEGLWTSDARN